MKTRGQRFPMRSPFHSWLRAECLLCRPGRSRFRLRLRREFLQVQGVAQGGILSAYADMAAIATAYPFLPEGETATSVEFKINFMAPVSKGYVTAEARALRRGRRVLVSECELRQGGTLVAKGIFTYLIYREEPRNVRAASPSSGRSRTARRRPRRGRARRRSRG